MENQNNSQSPTSVTEELKRQIAELDRARQAPSFPELNGSEQVRSINPRPGFSWQNGEGSRRR